ARAGRHAEGAGQPGDRHDGVQRQAAEAHAGRAEGGPAGDGPLRDGAEVTDGGRLRRTPGRPAPTRANATHDRRAQTSIERRSTMRTKTTILTGAFLALLAAPAAAQTQGEDGSSAPPETTAAKA